MKDRPLPLALLSEQISDQTFRKNEASESSELGHGSFTVVPEEFLPRCQSFRGFFYSLPDDLGRLFYIKIGTSRQILPPEKMADFCALPLELTETVQNLIHISRRDSDLIQVGGLTAADPLVGPCDPTPHPGLTERIADRTL